jgi:hypothetical protein
MDFGDVAYSGSKHYQQGVRKIFEVISLLKKILGPVEK